MSGAMEWTLGLRHPVATPIFLALSALGDANFLTVFLPLAYWLGSRLPTARLTVLVAVAGLVNGSLKGIFGIPRPDVAALIEVGGSSFPSGHAQLAATMWPWLAAVVASRWPAHRWTSWSVAVALILGVAASRVYLGVHRPIDVLAGMLVGGVTVAVACYFCERPPRWWRRWPRFGKLAWLVVVVVAMLVFVPDGSEGSRLKAAGLLIGFGGALLIWPAPLALARSAGGRALAAAGLGVVVVFALRAGLEPLLMPLGSLADGVRYTVIGLWVAVGGPWLIARLGDARSASGGAA